MIAYMYKIGNQSIQTTDLNTIPDGMAYETIELAEFNDEKEIEIERNRLAFEMLKETDWYVVRFIETGRPIPQEILDLRQKIRDEK